ncbi:MAG: ABC transporter ATP-binding protein [Cytophagales bacterium]|nr:ABC transporter ATP-binding protein [Rhizobacter sp.]
MADTPVLQATQLTRHFGGLVAVNAVSLSLHVGEVHAVIGTNGAGKSTLVNLLSGELPCDAGSVQLSVNEVMQDVTHWPQPRRARAGMARSYQRSTLFAEFSVLENCRLSAQAALQRPWRVWEPAARCERSLAIAHEVLHTVGLSDVAQQLAGTLSHGQKRQLEVAMCLATRARVLLLDEPLAGMGAEETERMLSLLQALKPTHAVLLVEHDMDAVFRVADRVTVMVDGRVIASDAPDAIRNHPEVLSAYLGEAFA